MNVSIKISRYQLRDLLRSKVLIIYTAFFFLVTYCLFRFVGDTSKVVVSLMNIILIIIPLISIIFGTTYYYNSREFIVLLLAQPINRSSLFTGMCIGVSLPLIMGFLAGVGIPLVIWGAVTLHDIDTVLMLLFSGALLTFIFVAMAFFISVANEDKLRGLGISLLLWLLLSVVYDGLVMLAVVLFADYPLETPLIVLSILNPIDLARVLILLKFDISALMGYTGAVFQKFFGSSFGMLISLISLTFWAAISFAMGMKFFKNKDF